MTARGGLLLVLMLAAGPLGAQAPASQPPEAGRPGLPVDYERSMLELSETLGSLAFLNMLCRPAERPNPWQKRMERLVESEGAAQGNRERLMGAYNAGFSAFSTSYRRCTAAASTARSVLLRETGRLARALEQRYGG